MVNGHTEDADVTVTVVEGTGTCCDGGNTWGFPVGKTETKCGSLSSQNGDVKIRATVGTGQYGEAIVTEGQGTTIHFSSIFMNISIGIPGIQK